MIILTIRYEKRSPRYYIRKPEGRKVIFTVMSLIGERIIIIILTFISRPLLTPRVDATRDSTTGVLRNGVAV